MIATVRQCQKRRDGHFPVPHDGDSLREGVHQRRRRIGPERGGRVERINPADDGEGRAVSHRQGKGGGDGGEMTRDSTAFALGSAGRGGYGEGDLAEDARPVCAGAEVEEGRIVGAGGGFAVVAEALWRNGGRLIVHHAGCGTGGRVHYYSV